MELKHHKIIFNQNPFFIRDYLSSVKTCRYKPNDRRWISIHWKKHGPACTVILSEIKAFNIESTIEFFKRKTIELSNITSEEFDGIEPKGGWVHNNNNNTQRKKLANQRTRINSLKY